MLTEEATSIGRFGHTTLPSSAGAFSDTNIFPAIGGSGGSIAAEESPTPDSKQGPPGGSGFDFGKGRGRPSRK